MLHYGPCLQYQNPEAPMTLEDRVPTEIVMDALRAVEERQPERLAALYHPEIEFNWPPGLPYSGRFTGRAIEEMTQRFAATWVPLQPTEETRRMRPRILALGEDGRVVVNYLWKAMDTKGRRFETEVLADYQVRDGRLARAQMFYYDLPGMIDFLRAAGALH
jgi:ketosteroid isomerase-like protein